MPDPDAIAQPLDPLEQVRGKAEGRAGSGARAAGVAAGDLFTRDLCLRRLDEGYRKLQAASNRDVHDDSKSTTLPISLAALEAYVLSTTKLPWYVDLLNITLGNHDLNEAKRRIKLLADAFRANGMRITANLDF